MNTQINEKLVRKILTNPKKITGYFTHISGVDNSENFLKITKKSSHTDTPMQLAISLMIQFAGSLVRIEDVNNSAAQISVKGVNYPIYFVKFDSGYYISKNICTHDCSARWNFSKDIL